MDILKTLAAAAITAVMAIAVPAYADPDKNESGKSHESERYSRYEDKHWDAKDEKKQSKAERKRDRHDDDRHAYSDVPKGHMPPPGECKLWYPDRPAGHQPPPARCENLGQAPSRY